MEAFRFDPELLSRAERPWHGLHLGITRGNKDLDVKTIEENSSLSIDAVKMELKQYLKDPIFRQIQNQVFVVELEAVFRQLSVPYSFRSEEHTSELQSRPHLVCRLLLEKKKKHNKHLVLVT